MSSPIHPADWEHFSIIRESLSLDGLHVAMVGRDRDQLLGYAATLAVTLATQDRWHIEKYDPQRLEALIVDLMLNRFDAALQTLSDHARSPIAAHSPGCVLFIPDAHTIPRAAFLQLVRLAAGTRDQRLRLVALFVVDDPICQDRILAMGPQVARWDLDDDEPDAGMVPILPSVTAHRLRSGNLAKALHGRGRFLVSAATAVVLSALPLIWPAVADISPVFSVDVHNGAGESLLPTFAGTLGPESLPVTVMPENGQAGDAVSNAVRATEGVAASKAVEP